MQAASAPPSDSGSQGRATRPQRIAVMVSGSGSNLQAVLDACDAGSIDGEVVAVISNKSDVFALQRADAAGVPAVHVGLHPDEDRGTYDARLADVVAGFAPDVIVLAGWMRLLTMSFLGWFPERVINLHPAMPGELPGTHAIERAWDEASAGTRSQTGVMVHLVPDAGVDDGPVLGTATINIDTAVTYESFEASVHEVEHRLLVETLIELGRHSPSELAALYQSDSNSDRTHSDRKEVSA